LLGYFGLKKTQGHIGHNISAAFRSYHLPQKKTKSCKYFLCLFNHNYLVNIYKWNMLKAFLEFDKNSEDQCQAFSVTGKINLFFTFMAYFGNFFWKY